MDLLDLRTEVQAHGFNFDPSRINRYLNDAYMLVCRRVDYYIDETTYDFQTVSGTAKYALPGNFARVREVWDTDRNIAFTAVGLRDIDMSGPSLRTGPPTAYALDAANLHLSPTPDGVYNLELRYWLLPSTLAQDTDSPTIPADWQRLLTEYAIARCYWADDDPNMGGAWDNKFATTLAEFSADVKFPDTEYPSVAKSMWEQGSSIPSGTWSVWGWS